MNTQNEKTGAPAPERGGEPDRLALAGLMHDLANMLAVLRGWLQMAREADNEAARQRAIITGLACLPRVRELLDTIDALKGGGVLPPSNLKSTDDVIAETLEFFAVSLLDGIDLYHEPRPQLWRVTMSGASFSRVLINLLENACEAMPNGGAIGVMADNLDLGPVPAAASAVRPGRYVLLTVQDSGPGIPPTVLEVLFQPFASGKPPGSGTGLGLATVKQLVEQCGGGIRCDSSPGRGTCFSLFLPAAPGQ